MLRHPRKSEFDGQPIWIWVNACADAEQLRGDLLSRLHTLNDTEKEFILSEKHLFPREMTSVQIENTSGVLTHIGTSSPGIHTKVTNDTAFVETTGIYIEDHPNVPNNAVLVFDTETTGISKQDQIIQMGYQLFTHEGEVLRTYEKIWQGHRSSNPFALLVHQIPDKVVKTSPNDSTRELKLFADLTREVQNTGGTVVAHNAKFDTRMVKQTADLLGLDIDIGPVFCTMKSLKKRTKEERGQNCKNEDVYIFLGGKSLGKMHTALVDTKATAHIYFYGKKADWWF
jgi:DNA polymerase III epsilon subunit-like protein